MIHQGQEYARSKVVANEPDIKDSHMGQLDHNSYNKDNETNYVNYDHADLNKELLDYYTGLIKLRKSHDAFKKADYENYEFVKFPKNEFAIAYKLVHKNNTYFVAFNANTKSKLTVNLPDGWWQILADKNSVLSSNSKSVKEKISLGSSEGIVLKLK